MRAFWTIIAALMIASGATRAVAQNDMMGFDRADFGAVVLSQRQFAGDGGVDFEAAVQNYNNEPIDTYSANSAITRLGRAVGRLDILTDAGVFPCTAFLVDEGKILTNWHCVPGITELDGSEATRIEAISFLAGYRSQGVVETAQRFTVSPVPLEFSQSLDYAILEVFGTPAEEFGTLKLSGRTLEEGDPFWVIGHPMGEAQRISREQCRAAIPALSNNRLRHTCDTLPGNSGSPVIDASRQEVIALHHAGSRRDQVNFAVPMSLILEASEVLRPAAPPKPPPGETQAAAPSGPDCGALYLEAERIGACFAYRAYVEICGDHPLSSFARFYVEESCTAPAASTPPEPEPEPEPRAPEPQPEPEAMPDPTDDFPIRTDLGAPIRAATSFRAYDYQGLRIIERIGGQELLRQLQTDTTGPRVELTYRPDFENASIRAGKDYRNGYQFYRLALIAGAHVATVEVYFPRISPGPSAAEEAIIGRLACTAVFQGQQLPCASRY